MMDRLVLDRLWPLLVGMVALIAGAVLLEQMARRRGNGEVRIVIQASEQAPGEEDDESGAAVAEDDPVLDDTHAKARRLAARGEVKDALPLFERAVQAHPDSAPLRGEYGHWLMVARERRQALEHLARAAALQPQAARWALQLGKARLRNGEDALAGAELRRALALRPSYGAARIALGNLLRRNGKHDEAVEVLRPASVFGGNEERARALVALGASQLAQGRRADAEKAFDEATLLAPSSAEVRLSAARAWLDTGRAQDAETALQLLTRTAELAPDLAGVHAALGRARELLGEIALAVQAYEQAVRLDPANRYARRRLLKLALQERDLARARAEADRLLKDAPDEPEHHFLAALVADRADKPQEARTRYQEAIALAGGHYPEALLNLGLLEKGEGRLQEAQAAYEEALRQRPGYLAAYGNLGQLHEAGGRLEEARSAYEKAIELDPTYASGHLRLGNLHLDAKRFPEAIAALEAALRARPGYPKAMLNLGVAYSRSKNFDQAIATYRKLLEANPRYGPAWYNLALALDSAGKAPEARAALEKGLEINEGHLPSLRKLAELERAAGRLREARSLLEDLLDHDPSSRPARLALAEVLADLGDRAGCQEYARALQADASDDERVRSLSQRCTSPAAGSAP